MAARLGELYGWTCGAGREVGMQGRLSFFIQMLPRGKFWLEVADEKLTSSIMRTRFVFVVSVYYIRVDAVHMFVYPSWWLVMASHPVNSTG